MKKITLWQLLIALFLIVSINTMGQEIMLNGNVEDWDDATHPTNWTKVENIDQESDPANVHGGTYSAKHTGGTKDLGQYIGGIIPGDSYTISIWYKVVANDGTDARIWSYWRSGGSNIYDNGAELRGPNNSYFDNNGGVWTEYTTTITAPATADELYFEVRTYSGAVTYWDDMSVFHNTAPIVAAPTFNPPAGEYPNSPQNITISTTTSGATIYYTTDGNDPDNTSTVYAAPINIATNTTLKAFAEKTGEIDSQITSGDYVIIPATTTIPYEENFVSNLGDCYTYSVSGDTKGWYWTSGYAKMNGYNSGDVEEDWLILPGINFDGSSDYMTFDTWQKYGSDDDDNYLKLMYSTDYSGLGDPSSATWTELSFTQPSSTATWTSSGVVWLSSIPGPAYIAFKYHYEAGSYRSWEVDNISIKAAPPVPLGSTGIIIAVLLITTVLVIRRGKLI